MSKSSNDKKSPTASTNVNNSNNMDSSDYPLAPGAGVGGGVKSRVNSNSNSKANNSKSNSKSNFKWKHEKVETPLSYIKSGKGGRGGGDAASDSDDGNNADFADNPYPDDAV